MDFRHYTAAPVELAVDLVNDYASEPRTAEGSQDQPLPPLAAFLDAHDVPHTGVGEDDLEAVVRLADRLFAVFAGDDDAAAVAVLNELLAEGGTRPRISAHDGSGWHLHFDSEGPEVVRRLAAVTAMGLATVVCDFGRSRLGACRGRSCRDVYVDTSRNVSRRYCSDSCSNRTNVAAFRARSRQRSDAVDQP